MGSQTFLAYLMSFLGLLSVDASEKLANHPGYVDFGLIEGSGIEPIVEVYLQDPLLRLAAEASRQQDPELGEILTEMRLIQVQVFEKIQDDVAKLQEQIRRITGNLENKGWVQSVRVRDEEEHVYIYLRLKDENVAGLLAIVAEPKEKIVFVNIVGSIDPAQFGRLGGKFNIPQFDSLSLKRPSQ